MASLWISPCKGCWVDLFEDAHFHGRRIRLYGPADFVNLPLGPDPGPERAASLVAGPQAYVLCFQELNRDAALWLAPGQRVANLASHPPNEALDSIRLFDRPPFATEPAFEAYARAHERPPEPIRLPRTPLPKK